MADDAQSAPSDLRGNAPVALSGGGFHCGGATAEAVETVHRAD
jgi:hypothetical protein